MSADDAQKGCLVGGCPGGDRCVLNAQPAAHDEVTHVPQVPQVETVADLESRLRGIAELRCGSSGAQRRFVHDSAAAALVREAAATLPNDSLEHLVSFYELTVLRVSREQEVSRESLLVEMWRFEAMLYDPSFLPVTATRLAPLAKELAEGDVVRVQFAFAVGGRAVDEVALQLEETKNGLWLGRVLTDPEALAGLLSHGDVVAFPESAVSQVAVVDNRTREFLATLRSG